MKKMVILMLVFVLAINLISCKDTNADTHKVGIIITDAYGKEIVLTEPPKRIISTYSAITENIYALGAGDLLIGGGSTELYPEEATKLQSFSYSKDDVEKFINANPDVIFFRKTIATKYADLISELESVGIMAIALDNADFHNFVITIAKVIGKESIAKTKLEEFESQLRELENRASAIPEEERVNIFFESSEKDYKTASQHSIAYIGLRKIGTNNVADKDMEKNPTSTIAYFGEEYLLAQANRIDVYIAQHGAMNKTATIESIKQRPGFDIIKAIKEDRILVVDEKLISSPTFRQIQGLIQIFEYIYPDY